MPLVGVYDPAGMYNEFMAFGEEVDDRFGARPASQWRDISLSDAEIVGLVNVRFLSRALKLRPERVVEAIGDANDIVGVFIRLRDGG